MLFRIRKTSIDQGKLAAAEQMYERALAGYEKALSPEHTSTLDSVHCLGNLYADRVLICGYFSRCVGFTSRFNLYL
jgi:Tetratricopeptide repeat